MAKEVVLRRLTCNWPDCGLVFYICNSCYRGHRYCGDNCRDQARQQQLLRADQQYRRSKEAQLDHRDRQREYRQRCRLRCVTDHTSASKGRSVKIGEPVRETGRSAPSEEDSQARPRLERLQTALRPVCMLCGRAGRVEVKRIGPERRQ